MEWIFYIIMGIAGLFSIYVTIELITGLKKERTKIDPLPKEEIERLKIEKAKILEEAVQELGPEIYEVFNAINQKKCLDDSQ